MQNYLSKVTLAQQHIITKLIQHFGTSQFMVRLHKCELKNGDSNFIMPVFVVIITKLKTALEKQQVCFVFIKLIKLTKFSRNLNFPTALIPRQSASIAQTFFSRRSRKRSKWVGSSTTSPAGYSITKQDNPNFYRGPVEETTIRIYTKTGQERYELIIVDASEVKTLCKYGVFIVPFGR